MNDVYKSIFNRSMSWLPVILAILILTGCATVGPDYVPPEMPVSVQKREAGLSSFCLPYRPGKGEELLYGRNRTARQE